MGYIYIKTCILLIKCSFWKWTVGWLNKMDLGLAHFFISGGTALSKYTSLSSSGVWRLRWGWNFVSSGQSIQSRWETWWGSSFFKRKVSQTRHNDMKDESTSSVWRKETSTFNSKNCPMSLASCDWVRHLRLLTLWLRPPDNYQSWSYTHSYNLTPVFLPSLSPLPYFFRGLHSESLYTWFQLIVLKNANTRNRLQQMLVWLLLTSHFLTFRKWNNIPALHDN